MKYKKTALNYLGRELTEFPNEIFTIRRVTKLNLSHNKIKIIPKEIAKLTHLETLDLSGNEIRHLYAKLFELPNLKILILNNNKIVNIPKQIANLQKLKILNLANNKITALPEELSQLCNLEELNITGNKLDSLPLNSNLPFPKLKSLWIGQNPLRQLSSCEIVNKLLNLKAFYCYSPKMDKPILSTDTALEYAAKAKGNSLSTLNGLHQDPEEMQNPTIINKPPTPRKKGKIFISYAHEDSEYLKMLKRHLKVLKRDINIDVWEDTRIRSSAKWKDEIEHALNEASTAILLVSTDFLASDFIQDEELPKLLKAAEEKGTRIHPVIVHPCRFLKIKSLSQFQAANSPSEPLSELQSPKQERVWMKLCDDIQDYLEE
jgi:hypothetical protein